MRARKNYDPQSVAFAIRRRSATGVNRKKVLRLIRTYIESTVPREGMRRLDREGAGGRFPTKRCPTRQCPCGRSDIRMDHCWFGNDLLPSDRHRLFQAPTPTFFRHARGSTCPFAIPIFRRRFAIQRGRFSRGPKPLPLADAISSCHRHRSLQRAQKVQDRR